MTTSTARIFLKLCHKSYSFFSTSLSNGATCTATSYMVAREDKRKNNRTMFNAAAGFKGPMKTELLKGAGLPRQKLSTKCTSLQSNVLPISLLLPLPFNDCIHNMVLNLTWNLRNFFNLPDISLSVGWQFTERSTMCNTSHPTRQGDVINFNFIQNLHRSCNH